MNSCFGDVKQSSPDLDAVPYTHMKRPLKPGSVSLSKLTAGQVASFTSWQARPACVAMTPRPSQHLPG